MAEFRLLTIWRIEAPLDAVYLAIRDSLAWPEWWPGALAAGQSAPGAADGVGCVRHYRWRGVLPFSLNIVVRTTQVAAPHFVEAQISGDLAGAGSWRFAREDGHTVVRHEWRVRTRKAWMSLLVPLARPLFVRNHERVMRRGAEALARRVGGRLLGVEHRTLAACPAESRRLAPALIALLAGGAAGTIATLAQILLWWLAGLPLLDTLLRDARLTAAIVLGREALSAASVATWPVVLVATLVHFALSAAYALLPARFAGRLPLLPALVAGGGYGVAIYAVNMYGFTAVFPWFALVRDPITLFAHVVFGIALVGACRWLAPPAAGRWP